MKIAFFDTKAYDRDIFQRVNEKFNLKIKFFDTKLTEDSVSLAKGYNIVCVFVNDVLNKNVIDKLVENGVSLIALRCAGFNNVDFPAIDGRLKVVRVPAYSPYAVAEHAATLMLSLNRKIHKAYARTREGNFTLSGLVGFDMNGKTAGIIGDRKSVV